MLIFWIVLLAVLFVVMAIVISGSKYEVSTCCILLLVSAYFILLILGVATQAPIMFYAITATMSVLFFIALSIRMRWIVWFKIFISTIITSTIWIVPIMNNTSIYTPFLSK